MGERGTQGTVDNYPHSKTHPPAVPSLAAPATDGKLEGVSENEAEDTLRPTRPADPLAITQYKSYLGGIYRYGWKKFNLAV